MLNFPERDCLRRDFVPSIMNTFADPALVKYLLAQKDYTGFARDVERLRLFDPPNVHASGHFGIGGVLGTMGNAANSPGGLSACNSLKKGADVTTEPLFYLHHGNLDRIFWTWQQSDLKTRLNQVGGPVVPFDYRGKNVTLDFQVNIGKLAGNVTLKDLLNTQGKTLCYTY